MVDLNKGRMNEIYLLSFLTVFLLTACSFTDDVNEAQSIADTLFSELAKGPTEKYYKLYTDEFYKHSSKKEWKKIRKRVNEKLGKYKEHNLINWKKNSTLSSGTRIILLYKVKYERYDADETLTLIDNNSLGIIGHHINSKGLLLE